MEHFQKKLKPLHLVFFWAGLCFDTAGTTIMTQISNAGNGAGLLSPHGITGLLAILLMVVHAIWASVVLVRKNERAQASFHKFSIAVWCVWLIPFVLGMMMGMR